MVKTGLFGRILGCSCVAASMALWLAGCKLYGFDPALRQVTAPSVIAPLPAEANMGAPQGLQTPGASALESQDVASVGSSERRRATIQAASVMHSSPTAISNAHLWQWRAEAMAANVDQDPNKRPRRLPRPFTQVPWGDYLPLMPFGTDAKLSSDYGWRNRYGSIDFHSGIDIVAPVGTPVFTPVGGVVISAPRGSAGKTGIVVLSGERQYSFWHTTPLAGLQAGDIVGAGQPIGTLANWGARTHLHFAVHLTGETRDSSVRNDHNAVDPINTTWRALQSGLDLFSPSMSEGRDILALSDGVLHRFGF